MSVSPPQFPDIAFTFNPTTGLINPGARGIAGAAGPPAAVTVIVPGSRWSVLIAPLTASADVEFYFWTGWVRPLANPIAAPTDVLGLIFDRVPPGDNSQLSIQCVDGAGALGVATSTISVAGFRIPTV